MSDYTTAAKLLRETLLSRSTHKSHRLILKDVKRELDSDDNGVLERSEVKLYIETLGVIDDKIINQILDAIDLDRSGKIDFEELSSFLFPTQNSNDLLLNQHDGIEPREFGLVAPLAKSAVIRTVGIYAAENTEDALLKAFGKLSNSHLKRGGLLDDACVAKSFLALTIPELINYPKLMPYEVEMLVKSLDTNGDGVVSANEFRLWLNAGKSSSISSPQKQVSSGFKSPLLRSKSANYIKSPKSPIATTTNNNIQVRKSRADRLIDKAVSQKMQAIKRKERRDRYKELNMHRSLSSSTSTIKSSTTNKSNTKSISSKNEVGTSNKKESIPKTTTATLPTTTTTTTTTSSSSSGLSKIALKEVQSLVHNQLVKEVNNLNLDTGSIATDVYKLKKKVSVLEGQHDESRKLLNQINSFYKADNKKIAKSMKTANNTKVKVKEIYKKLNKAQENLEKRLATSSQQMKADISKLFQNQKVSQRNKSGKDNKKSDDNINNNKSQNSVRIQVKKVSKPSASLTSTGGRKSIKKVVKHEPLWKPSGSLKYWKPPQPKSPTKSSSLSEPTTAMNKEEKTFLDRLNQSVSTWSNKIKDAAKEEKRIAASKNRLQKSSDLKGPRWQGPKAIKPRPIIRTHSAHYHSHDSNNQSSDDKPKNPLNKYKQRLLENETAAKAGKQMMADLRVAMNDGYVYVSSITLQEEKSSSILDESKDDWWHRIQMMKEGALRDSYDAHKEQFNQIATDEVNEEVISEVVEE